MPIAAASAEHRTQPWAVTLGVALIVAEAWVAATSVAAGADWRRAALVGVGALIGVTLYHAAFGFTAGWRRAIAAREVSGALAQVLMVGLAVVLFAPVLAGGEVLGQRVAGALAPVGVQVAVGSLLFGLGMQLAGGCGSGTLYTVGGGSARMVLTLVAFCAGGFGASLQMSVWQALPNLGVVSLAESLGWGPALAVQLGLLALIWFALRHWGRNAPQRPLWPGPIGWRRLASGPWPIVLGAGALAFLNLATLVLAGHPWTITWGFTLWGAKAARALGWDPTSSPFWTGAFQEGALNGGLLDDVTSLMNLAIITGAFSAAALAGRLAPVGPFPWRSAVAAGIGGLAMGYGARLAFGCNIGAFFSGVASASLHGWLWLACALAGTIIGVRLRPLFGLAVEDRDG